MSLIDTTNEHIQLSQHFPEDLGDTSGAADLWVDVDADSSFTPSQWVHIIWTDDSHDADRIKLTFEEAGLVHDRLGLILGRSIERHIPTGLLEAARASVEYNRERSGRPESLTGVEALLVALGG